MRSFELELKQEAANLTASVANFVLASPSELREEIARIDQSYEDAPQELHEAAVTIITALKSLIPAAEQREAVERQQREQEAERERLEVERRAEEERKRKAEADREAEAERKQREAEAETERKRLAEEAECRRAEDIGQTVTDIMDYVPGCDSDIAEKIVDAIINGEISHVFWSNEK